MTESSAKQITYRVQRYNPEKGGAPYLQEFLILTKRGMTVLDGLIYIKENLDSTLAFRTSCRMGICGSCGMLVNNYPYLACHTQIEEFNSDVLTVKPLPNLAIIKDLVVDLTLLFEKHKAIKPYLVRSDKQEQEQPTAEFAQLPGELDEFEQFSYCIKCGICIAACPSSASDVLFLGPQALAQCYHYCADNRDEGQKERFSVAESEHGVWRCHLAGACSEACPKGVDPAFAIQLLKRMLVKKAFGQKLPPVVGIVSQPTEKKPKVPYPEFTVKNK